MSRNHFFEKRGKHVQAVRVEVNNNSDVEVDKTSIQYVCPVT